MMHLKLTPIGDILSCLPIVREAQRRREPLTAREILNRYPHLIRGMCYLSSASHAEVLVALRDYRAGSPVMVASLQHWSEQGGNPMQSLLHSTWKLRRAIRRGWWLQ